MHDGLNVSNCTAVLSERIQVELSSGAAARCKGSVQVS